MRDIDGLLEDEKLQSEIQSLTFRIRGWQKPLALVHRLFFSVIAANAGMSACESAMRNCLSHMEEIESNLSEAMSESEP